MIILAVFTDASTEQKAENILSKLIEHLGLKTEVKHIEAYSKGGYQCTLNIEHSVEDWQQAVYECLIIAQAIGYSWTITGNVTEEIDLWSNKTKFSGITSFHLQAEPLS